jgi:hypothetical protein
MLCEVLDADLFHFVLHGVWIPAYARTTRKKYLNAQFSEHSSRCIQTLPCITRHCHEEEDVMERRHFLKVAFGFAAGAAALAASAQATPLPPISTAQGLAPPRSEGAEPAVVTQDDVNRIKPEQVRWGHHRHWHRRHWGWHRRWHRRHWRHRRYW